MVIDCDTCVARFRACGDCVVTHLLAVSGAEPGHGPGRRGAVSLDEAEVAAVATMSAAGLVPPLRLVAS